MDRSKVSLLLDSIYKAVVVCLVLYNHAWLWSMYLSDQLASLRWQVESPSSHPNILESDLPLLHLFLLLLFLYFLLRPVQVLDLNCGYLCVQT